MKVKASPYGLLLLLLLFTATGSDAQLSVCGTAPLNTRGDTRIVGGQDADAGAWPWQARLSIGNALCGGSLINNQWILSAAHCFSASTSASSVTVYLGLETTTPDSNSVRRGASQIIRHPDYNEDTNDNDMALVQLDSTVEFTDYIRPVCLAAPGSVFPAGQDCWATGWGTLEEGGDIANTLQEVDVPIVSNDDCRSSYSTLTDNMICAGLTDGGKDSCQGDSGGPLVSKNGSVWVQAGVVSFGIGCARPGFPGVYARVSEYQSWINSHITENQPGYVNFQGTSSGAARFVSLSLPLLLSVPTVVFSLFVLS